MSKLHESLVKVLCAGDGLEGLARILADYIGGGAVLSAPDGTILTMALTGKLDEVQCDRLRRYAAGCLGAGRTNSPVRKDARANTLESALFDGFTVHRYARQLDSGGEYAGILTVIRPGMPFSADDIDDIDLAAGYFCICLTQDKKIAGIELRLKGNFVEDLVSSHFSDPDSILSRARALAYDIQAGHRVLTGKIDASEKETALYKNELIRLIQGRLDETHKGMAILSKDELIILVQMKKPEKDITGIKALAEKIVSDAALQFKIKLYIGIGSACLELSDFSKSYMEAKKALEIGEYMITEGQVRSFEQFKVHALFLSTLKPADLYNYAREQLEALLLYDEKHHTDFLKTLQEFLYLRNNVEGTAKTLRISVSGLKYRLQKIEKIIGHQLKDYKVCFDLQLALVILQLFGEYRIK